MVEIVQTNFDDQPPSYFDVMEEMANELYGISSIKSPQDIPLDHAETQTLQVIIQVPDTVNAERSNSGNCRCLCITYAILPLLFGIMCGLGIISYNLYNLVILFYIKVTSV